MNNVSLIGRLVKDNDFKVTPSGTKVLKNTLAVPRKFKKDETDFISLVAFGKTAELITNHLNKGDQVGIEGYIQTGSYEKEGRKVYTTDVVVDSVTFISSKGKGQETQNNAKKPPSKRSDNPFAGGQINISDDDLPF